MKIVRSVLIAEPARALVLALALWLVLGPGYAQDSQQKPTIAEQTDAIEIEIFIDDALAAFPRLHQTLLDEAKRIVSERRVEADAEWRDNRELFRIGRWYYERSYDLDVSVGPYVSVSVLESSYSGGAHPNSSLDTLLWNREQERRTDITALFREARTDGPTLTALAKLIRAGVAAEKRERDVDVAADPAEDTWLKEIKPELDTLGAPSLEPSTEPGKSSGISFHFSPYAVGPYVEGFYSAFVSWRSLEPYLTDEASALFGGARPADDTDGAK